jgi:hypothetical protein
MPDDACTLLATELGVDVAIVRELWAERAAVREFDGGQSREAAEAAALADVRELLATRRGPRSARSIAIVNSKRRAADSE